MARSSKRKGTAKKTDFGSGSDTEQPRKKISTDTKGTAGKNVIDVAEADGLENGGVRVESLSTDTKGTAGKNVIDVAEADGVENGGVRVESSADVGSSSESCADEKQEKTAEAVMSAAFGSDQTDLDEKDEDSNLADIEPEVGMEIDFRDPDYIWSSGKIVGVKATKAGKKQVTVQYDGWPPDWNEVVSWPSVRVAKLFTYTKRVRCFVDGILPKKAPPKKKPSGDFRITCHVWPCTVRFRMPHPAHMERAEELLRLEPNVFVQPYAPGTLPEDIVCTIENNGIWMHNSKLRMWKNENALSVLGTVHPSFEFAYKLGQNDTATPGRFPSRALEVGSLLNTDYRVLKVGGEAVKGQMYTGECPDPKPTVPKFVSSKKSTGEASTDRKLRSEEANLKAEAQAKRRLRIQRPPKLPPPLIIYDPSFKLSSEAVRLRETKRWGAAISVGGNDLFLGSFPSQSHAIASSAIALAKDASEVDDGGGGGSAKPPEDVDEESSPVFPSDEMEGQIADLNATRLEDSICALERSNKHGTFGTFSLRDWTMQSIRYQAYKKQEREKFLPQSGGDGKSGTERSAPYETSSTKQAAEMPKKISDTNVEVADSQHHQEQATPKPTSKRKQSNPRRLNLDTRIYDPPRSKP